MKLEEFLVQKFGYNKDIKDTIQSALDMWKSWYEGDVKDFHNYFIYNGKVKVPQKRYTMNMAKSISEDWSDILWSEKCKISMKDEQNQSQFDELLDKLDLNVIINQSIEKSGALGTVAVVAGVYDLKSNADNMTLDVSDAKTRLDIVDVDWIYPLSWNNKEIVDCAFGSVEYKDGKKYVVVSVHKLEEDNNYHIYNYLFLSSKDGNLTPVEIGESTFTDFNTGSNTKWFAIFKPLLTNNLYNNCPFGIPHYANSIDNLKAVDIAFDSIKNEIQDGRKRVFVRADMMNYDDGEGKLTFDPNDTTVYQLPSGATKEDLIQSDSDTLRTAQQIDTLNTELSILADKVGLGSNYYTYDGTNLQTATAVISSNSKMFRRKKKLEIGYESAIYDLVKAVCYASSQFGKYNINAEDMVIQFDDSIIEDKDSESIRARAELSAGVLGKVEYRMKIFGETREIAEENIRLINEENPSVEDLMGGSEE